MLTAYRKNGNVLYREGAVLPDNIIWIDLLNPTPGELSIAENHTKIRLSSKEALSEIEASSRLIVQPGVLILSTPMVTKGELDRTEISPAGFVLTPNFLVTVRFRELAPFDTVAERLNDDKTIGCGVGVFATLLEAIVDRGADVLEHLGRAIDKVSEMLFHSDSGPKRRAQSTARLHKLLCDIGKSSNRLAQAREVLLGVGRLADFVRGIGHDWIPEAFRVRLHAITKDVSSLSDYETHLSDKVQFLLDAALGYISIEQNDLFKILTIVSVIGVPPTLLVGIWGMNFKNMPELGWAWGYPFSWIAIVLTAVLPLIWLKRRGWF